MRRVLALVLVAAAAAFGAVSCTDGAQWVQRGDQWCLQYQDAMDGSTAGVYCRIEPAPLTERPDGP